MTGQEYTARGRRWDCRSGGGEMGGTTLQLLDVSTEALSLVGTGQPLLLQQT